MLVSGRVIMVTPVSNKTESFFGKIMMADGNGVVANLL